MLQERFFGADQQMPADGGTLTATVTSPEGEILDEFPEAAGLHWNGLATEKDDLAIVAPSYRFESTQTTNTDGSSSYAFHEAGNVSTDGGTKVVRPDGSARSDYRHTGSFEEVDTIGLPQAAGGHYVIPITTSGGNPTANATPTPAKTVDVPDWYPSHDLAPRPLVSESVTNEGRSAIPGVCGRTGPAFRLHMTCTGLRRRVRRSRARKRLYGRDLCRLLRARPRHRPSAAREP